MNRSPLIEFDAWDRRMIERIGNGDRKMVWVVFVLAVVGAGAFAVSTVLLWDMLERATIAVRGPAPTQEQAVAAAERLENAGLLKDAMIVFDHQADATGLQYEQAAGEFVRWGAFTGFGAAFGVIAALLAVYYGLILADLGPQARVVRLGRKLVEVWRAWDEPAPDD